MGNAFCNVTKFFSTDCQGTHHNGYVGGPDFNISADVLELKGYVSYHGWKHLSAEPLVGSCDVQTNCLVEFGDIVHHLWKLGHGIVEYLDGDIEKSLCHVLSHNCGILEQSDVVVILDLSVQLQGNGFHLGFKLLHKHLNLFSKVFPFKNCEVVVPQGQISDQSFQKIHSAYQCGYGGGIPSQ